MNGIVTRVARICGYAALTILLAVVVGCGQSESETPPSAEEMARRVDHLRSLPYLSGTSAPEDKPTGVVLFDEERTCPGYRLYTIAGLGRAELISERGDVVRRWERPGDLWMRAELLPNGDLLVVGAEDHGWQKRGTANDQIADGARYVMRLDWSGELVWQRTFLSHHDIELTPDDRLLLLTFERRKDPRIHASLDTRDDHLTLLGQDGDVVASKSVLDAVWRNREAFPLQPIGPSDTGVRRWVDVFHANSVEWMHHESLFSTHALYGPDNILMCFRHQDRIAVFNWSENRFIWSWGRGQISGPHDAQVLENGHILLFDNGLSRGWSRAIELDPLSGEIVWTYEGEPRRSFYTIGRGSAQRLPNGNTLLAESDKGRAIEVTRDGTIVWEFNCPYGAGRHSRASIARVVYHPAERIDGLLTALD